MPASHVTVATNRFSMLYIAMGWVLALTGSAYQKSKKCSMWVGVVLEKNVSGPAPNLCKSFN